MPVMLPTTSFLPAQSLTSIPPQQQSTLTSIGNGIGKLIQLTYICCKIK